MRILLIEPRPGIRSALQIILQQAGHETVTAASAVDARVILRGTQPQCVVLYDAVRDLPNRHLCRVIKSTPNLTTLPVIVYASEFHILSIPYIQAIGADAALSYPFSPQQLLNTLRRLQQQTISQTG